MIKSSVISYVSDVIDFIEYNIHETLRIETISKELHISKSYLQKVFKSVTGVALMDYVRARKLNYCLVALKESDDTIVNIASQFNYSYQQSFSRAFKSHFGISPKYYRDHSFEVEITPKIDIAYLINRDD